MPWYFIMSFLFVLFRLALVKSGILSNFNILWSQPLSVQLGYLYEMGMCFYESSRSEITYLPRLLNVRIKKIHADSSTIEFTKYLCLNNI